MAELIIFLPFSTKNHFELNRAVLQNPRGRAGIRIINIPNPTNLSIQLRLLTRKSTPQEGYWKSILFGVY